MGLPGEGFLLLFLLFAFTTITWNIPYIWIKPRWDRYLLTREKAAEARKLATERLKEQPDPDIYNTAQYAIDEEEKDFHHIKKENSGEEPYINRRTKKQPESSELELEVIYRNKQDENTEQDDGLPEEESAEPIKSKTISEIEFTVETPPVSAIQILESEVPTESDDQNTGHQGLDVPYDPTLDLPEFRTPELELLQNYGSDTVPVQKDELETNKKRIVETLANYQISISKIKATIGPTVTLYEIIPAPGVRISRIKNLEDDIALSLSALGIRIIAPIPGKGTIGIEVPNQNPEIVSMRSMLASDKFQQSKFDLPIAIGKTISNEPYIADLAKMPHLLMAGATGQGKSVGLNAIIASLLYKKHPSQLKFVMVDPKKVELTLFSKIERHYLAKLPDSEEAIITDTRQVVRTLNSLSIEMDNRYELLKDAQVRNIKEYNTKFIARRLSPLHGHRYLPYIVLVVDEFADLIMTAGREIEMPIARLAQLARAIGIHLIIATQRPSVNIITGTIKANFPARVAFRV
ncbi:MAG TPA: cell division protein FtsK, partial [Bacteroidales bacterium]|nr:cell division protein FtsK [Bacteroidales bacterium]